MTRSFLFSTVIALLIGVGIGFVIGRYTKPNRAWETIMPNPVVLDLGDQAVPDDFNEGTVPDAIERLVIRDRFIIDTLYITVPVPAELAADSTNLALVTERPVEVNRPLFGTPSITLTTYPIEGGAFERQTFMVPPNPIQIGMEIGLGVEDGIPSLGLQPVLTGQVYLGYRGAQTVGGVRMTPEGLRWTAGIRYRLGR